MFVHKFVIKFFGGVRRNFWESHFGEAGPVFGKGGAGGGVCSKKRHAPPIRSTSNDVPKTMKKSGEELL